MSILPSRTPTQHGVVTHASPSSLVCSRQPFHPTKVGGLLDGHKEYNLQHNKMTKVNILCLGGQGCQMLEMQGPLNIAS